MFEWLLLAIHCLPLAAASQYYQRAANASALYVTTQSTQYQNVTAPPATGTGLEYASACNSAKHTWMSLRGSTFASSKTYTTSTSTVSIEYNTATATFTYYAGNGTNGTTYTLCDGYPRIDGHTETSTSRSNTTHTLSVWTYTTSSAVYQNLTPPACSIQSSDCAALNTSYYNIWNKYTSYLAASRSSYLSQLSATRSQSGSSTVQAAPGGSITPAPAPTEDYPPQCGVPTIPPTTSAVGPPTCFVNFASIQLLFWPVTRLPENDSCPNDTTSTLTMGPTISGKPNTFVYWNSTLTSPTVYMAFDGTWVFKSAGQTFSNQSRMLLPQSSTAVSSLPGKPGGGFYPPERVNYADFNHPVPASAYRAQPKCYTRPFSMSSYTTTQPMYPGGTPVPWTIGTYHEFTTENQCSTIWDDYRPVLSIPPEFSTMDPAHHAGGSISCPFLFDSDAVFFDPPIALTEASSVAEVTTPGSGGGSNEATTTKETPPQTAEPGTVAAPTTPTATKAPNTATGPKASEGYTALPESEDTGGDGSNQQTGGADPQPTADSGSGSSEGSDNGSDSSSGDNGSNDEGSAPSPQGSDSQENSQGSNGQNSGASGSGASGDDDASEGEGQEATPTTSRGIGEIIASVLGMSTDPGSQSSSTAIAGSGSSSDESAGNGGSEAGSDGSDPSPVSSSGNPSDETSASDNTNNDQSGTQSSGADGTSSSPDPNTEDSSSASPNTSADDSQSDSSPEDQQDDSEIGLATKGDPVTAAVLTGSDGSTVTVVSAPGGGALIEGATLSSGVSTSIEGIGNVVIGPSGAVVHDSTMAYSTMAASAGGANAGSDRQEQVITVDGQLYTASLLSDGDVVLVNAQTTATVEAGGPLTTLGTQAVSAGTSGQLAVGSNTITVAAADAIQSASVFTVGDQTYTANADGGFQIGCTILAPGHMITVSGTTYSLAPAG